VVCFEDDRFDLLILAVRRSCPVKEEVACRAAKRDAGTNALVVDTEDSKRMLAKTKAADRDGSLVILIYLIELAQIQMMIILMSLIRQ